MKREEFIFIKYENIGEGKAIVPLKPQPQLQSPSFQTQLYIRIELFLVLVSMSRLNVQPQEENKIFFDEIDKGAVGGGTYKSLIDWYCIITRLL